jgi:hypothetical protein
MNTLKICAAGFLCTLVSFSANAQDASLMPESAFSLTVIVLGFFAIITVIAVVLVLYFKHEATHFRKRLIGLLDDPRRIKELKNAELLDPLLEAVSPPKADMPIAKLIATRITHDIKWDIAGIIGLGVTVAIVIMAIASQADEIPAEIYSGWAVILGYYFGKASKEHRPQAVNEVSGQKGVTP